MPQAKTVEAAAPSLDQSRTQGPDLRDPRSKNAWPCFKSHNSSVRGSNKYGAWASCSVCALRTEYTPREGSKANQLATVDPVMVERALNLVKNDLRGKLPHHQLMTAALNKVESDMIYETMLQKPSTPAKTSTEMPKPKAKAKSYPSREQYPDNMSLQSWRSEEELLPPTAEPTAESVLEMMALMTEEQRAEMMAQFMSRPDPRLMNPNEEM